MTTPTSEAVWDSFTSLQRAVTAALTREASPFLERAAALESDMPTAPDASESVAAIADGADPEAHAIAYAEARGKYDLELARFELSAEAAELCRKRAEAILGSERQRIAALQDLIAATFRTATQVATLLLSGKQPGIVEVTLNATVQRTAQVATELAERCGGKAHADELIRDLTAVAGQARNTRRIA